MSNNTPLIYNDVIVVTTKQVAKEHDLAVKVVNQKFRRNRKYFVEKKDFYEVTKDMVTNCDHLLKMFYHDSDVLFFFTSSGYLKFVKTINDVKAWSIYNILIESYFKVKKLNESEAIFLRDNKKNRNCLTKEWSEHGAKNYSALTIKEYQSLFNDDTKRKKYMDVKELALLSAFEFLEQRKLENCREIQGDKNLKISLESTGKQINNILTNKTKGVIT